MAGGSVGRSVGAAHTTLTLSRLKAQGWQARGGRRLCETTDQKQKRTCCQKRKVARRRELAGWATTNQHHQTPTLILRARFCGGDPSLDQSTDQTYDIHLHRNANKMS
jgi:hypothetical protein